MGMSISKQFQCDLEHLSESFKMTKSNYPGRVIQYKLKLKPEEREYLNKALDQSSNKDTLFYRRVRYLLALDQLENLNLSLKELANYFGIAVVTLRSIIKKYNAEGIETLLHPRKTGGFSKTL